MLKNWSNTQIQNLRATAILTWDKDDSNYQVFHRHTCASGIPATLYTPAPAQVNTALLQCNNSLAQMTDASIAYAGLEIDDHWVGKWF